MPRKPLKNISDFWQSLDAIDAVEALFFVLLGTAIFLAINYGIGRAIWKSGSPLLAFSYGCLVVGVLVQCGIDIYRRKFSLTTYVIAGAWGLCVLAAFLSYALA